MKPQTLQTPRTIITGLMTVIGIGLFILVAVKAIRQVSDRQYVVGKQHAVTGAFHNNMPLAIIGSLNNYEPNLALQLGTPVNSPTNKATNDNAGTSQGKAVKKDAKQADLTEKSEKHTSTLDSENGRINDDVNSAINNSTSTLSKEVKAL